MKWINKRAQALSQGAIRAMFDRANAMPDIISLGIGEPDLSTPGIVCDAAKQALDLGYTHYTPNSGLFSLRKAIAEKTYLKVLNYDPESEIIITNGGMGALSLLFLVLLNEGDEVLIQDPQWLNYVAQVNYCGGTVVRVPTSAAHNFEMQPETIEALLTPRTKVIMINTPNNPTGCVMSETALHKIAEIAVKHDLLVISDDVYNTLLYSGATAPSIASFPGMRERTVVVNSFSKSFAMTGWRIGFVAAPAEIIDRMTKCQENFNACANSIGQYACTVALDHPELANVICKTFAHRREVLLQGLATIDGIQYSCPDGAFYVFADISSFGISSAEFCNHLLDEEKVVCIPGSAFGACGEGFIRIAYALRIPFDRLQRCEYGKTRRSAVLTASELKQAGFKNDQLTELMARLEDYQAQPSCKAGKLASALLTDNGKLSCFGKNFELASPSLHTIRADTPLRTFIFSGTAQLIPQLADNPNVTLLDTNFQESYARLTIHVQRDSVLKTSRTGLQTTGALEALVLWLQVLLPELAQTHGRVLLVSYKRWARRIWELLDDECREMVFTAVIPESDETCLPYFGGVAGSNDFRNATAVVCLGLPRLEPKDYLYRALAVDPDGAHAKELAHANGPLERQPCVLDAQDTHLAHELVQMVFRSRLRCHGDTAPVELWLTQPPDAVLTLLGDYFGDCCFEKHSALPSECHSKLRTSKQRNGVQTNAARLYEAMLAVPAGGETTPALLREQSGLTRDQYKEAIRATSVQALLRTEFTTFGSGRSQRIRRSPSAAAA